MTKIDARDDTKIPGRRSYVITGDTKFEVQCIIDARMRWVDTAMGGVPGSAHFIGPYRIAGGRYEAKGEVIIT
jgi:hypothetical protein